MYFALYQRVFFRHCNFKKWSDAEVIYLFLFGNVVRDTMAKNFSSLIWPAGSPAALANLLFDPPET